MQKANSSPVYDPVKGKMVVRSPRIEINYDNHHRCASQPIIGRYKNDKVKRRLNTALASSIASKFQVTFDNPASRQHCKTTQSSLSREDGRSNFIAFHQNLCNANTFFERISRRESAQQLFSTHRKSKSLISTL